MSYDAEGFRNEAARVMRSGTPSSGDNLLGMEMDFFVYLGLLDALDASSVSVRRTPYPETLIRADCAARPGTSVEQAADAVRQTWQEHLGYSFQKAHHLQVSGAEGLLRFVTQIGPAGFYVTGQVVVRANRPVP